MSTSSSMGSIDKSSTALASASMSISSTSEPIISARCSGSMSLAISAISASACLKIAADEFLTVSNLIVFNS